jgi:hypothetical protein
MQVAQRQRLQEVHTNVNTTVATVAEQLKAGNSAEVLPQRLGFSRCL